MWDFVEDISMKLGNFVTKKKFKQETEELQQILTKDILQ